MSRGHRATQKIVVLPQNVGQNLSPLLVQVPMHPMAQLSEPNIYEYHTPPRAIHHRSLHNPAPES